MANHEPPRVEAIREEANGIAPNRRKSSDGTYVNKPGGHNIGARGFEHAIDLGQSMPGTPYWGNGHDPDTGVAYDEFDVHALQREIAAQYVAATDAERKRRWRWLFDGGYMHSYDYDRKVDIIFHPAVSLTWRVDNNPPSEHIQHGHFELAETVAAENDTQPIFGGAPQEDDLPLNAADIKAIRDVVKQELNTAIGGPDKKKPGEWTGRLGATILHYTDAIADKVAAKLK